MTWVLRCLDCGRADPPCGWAPVQIVVTSAWPSLPSIVWEHRCQDCVRVQREMTREHALVGAD